MDFVTFEKYIENDYYAIGEMDEFEIRSAMDTHSLIVKDELYRYNCYELYNATTKIKNEKAFFYLRYGALKRLMMVHRSFESILQINYIDRESPLSHDEININEMHLNLLYMNLRAILDNFAWTIYYEYKKFYKVNLDKFDIGIFSNKLLSVINNKSKEKILKHKCWYKELASKRDPVAHRIPLSIPPSFQSNEENNNYNELLSGLGSSLGAGNFSKSEKLIKRMEEVGRYVPVFMHHPDDKFMNIYTTIPDDIVHMVTIGRIVVEILRERILK